MSREDILFEKILKRYGHSVTNSRQQLFKCLSSSGAISIHELESALPYDRSTLYRNIDLFKKLGVIIEIHLGWKHKYELSDIFQHHHHHITCVRCNKIITLSENTTLENAITRICKKNGIKQLDHQLEIKGICKRCQIPHKNMDPS